MKSVLREHGYDCQFAASGWSRLWGRTRDLAGVSSRNGNNGGG